MDVKENILSFLGTYAFTNGQRRWNVAQQL